MDGDPDSRRSPVPAMTSDAREPVTFITTVVDDDLIVAYSIPAGDSVVSLVLQRTPKYEEDLLPEQCGVTVSHELYPDDAPALVRRIVVDGQNVDIETTVRTYRVDLEAVDLPDRADARKVLRMMHRYGGFTLYLE